MELPKKVKAALKRLNIKGVVNGYFTQVPVANLKERAEGKCCAAFTCWNELGNVVCVLVKGPNNQQWELK